MPPGRAIEGADAASVWPRAALIACDRDKSIAGTSRHVRDNRARHSRIGMVVKGPSRTVESREPLISAHPDAAVGVRLYVCHSGARKRRIARVIQGECGVVSRREFPQTIFRGHPQVVAGVDRHGSYIVGLVAIPTWTERHVIPVNAVEPVHA